MRTSSIRFALIGALNTALDLLIFYALVTLGMSTLPANLISTGVTFALSFVLNRNWAFSAAGERWRVQLSLFIVVTLTALWIIQPALIVVLAPRVHELIPALDLAAAAVVAKVMATVVSMTWNYLLYHFVVFNKRWSAPKAAADAPESY